jgi:toxin YoeB
MRSKLVWTNAAREDYVYWENQDKKTLKRINLLVKEVMRDPEVGTGKPEPLRENLAGFWSR